MESRHILALLCIAMLMAGCITLATGEIERYSGFTLVDPGTSCR